MIDDIWNKFRKEEFDDAFAMATQAMAKQGGIDYIHLAGLSLMQLRNYTDGLLLLKAAIAFRPNAVHMYINSGYILERLGRADDLEYFVTRGLRDFPNDATLLQQQANVYLIRQDFAGAIKAYQGLLEQDPNEVRTHINLGNTFRLLTQFDKADAAYARAAEIEPDNASLRINRAALFTEQGRIDDAIALLERQREDEYDARFMLALMLLSQGDYKRGFDLHRDRWKSLLFLNASVPPRPISKLSDIDGKRICVLREGGFGDVFQFMRYLPAIASRAKEVLFHPLPSEMRLLSANLPSNVTLQRSPDSNNLLLGSDYEYTIALLDLPYWFETTTDTVPASIPYLHIPETAIQRLKLPPTTKKRIGLVWSGGPQTGINQRPYDEQRSIKLYELQLLDELTDRVEFHSLQFDDLKRVSNTVSGSLKIEQTVKNDFDWMDTAAVTAQMDLVISVDTAAVHLSAAMGKATWLLSRFNPCWRWLRNQPTSPWYPDILRVYGQSRFGDWSDVVFQLRQDIEKWLTNI